MVVVRGISVSMVSQHGARKIPEYEYRIPDSSPEVDETSSIAMCYVPSHPGSQVWFDYSIQDPHPPGARYLFKLVRNGEVFTTWDCTAKHGYQGRTTYALNYLGDHAETGWPVVQRQAFCFSTELACNVGQFDDCIEVRVYRIEHRVRSRLVCTNNGAHEATLGKNLYDKRFRLVDSGVLSSKDFKHHYKYQLLDSAERPYARLRFYYRTQEFLKRMGLVVPVAGPVCQGPTSSPTSAYSTKSSRPASWSNRSSSPSDNSQSSGSSRPGSAPVDSVGHWLHHHRLQKYTPILGQLDFDVLMACSNKDLAKLGVTAKGARDKLLREISACQERRLKQAEGEDEDEAEAEDEDDSEYSTEASPIMSSSPNLVILDHTPTSKMNSSRSGYVRDCLQSSGTETSPCIFTRNSVDDSLAAPIPSNRPVSAAAAARRTVLLVQNTLPRIPGRAVTASAPADKVVFPIEGVLPQFSSVKPSLKKNPKFLEVKINGADRDLRSQDRDMKRNKRPQSPFAYSGDMLRRLLHSPTPPSAPARITEFGPTIDDEIRETMLSSSSASIECYTPTKKSSHTALNKTSRAERVGNSGLLGKILKRNMA